MDKKYSDDIVRHVVSDMLQEWSLFDLEEFTFEDSQLKQTFDKWKADFVADVVKMIDRKRIRQIEVSALRELKSIVL
mgnify:CR=1 FL=1